MKCIFTVDVEDWFHILDDASAPGMADWPGMPSRVESDFARLLDLFAETDVKATCFFLGWIAARYPRLVSQAAAAGHGIASHGYGHRLAYELTPDEFYQDAVSSRDAIEDAAGCPVQGYRAAGFSVTERTPWFFEELIHAGYRYDSSVFPTVRSHGGLPGAAYAPHIVHTPSGDVAEFPVSITRLFGFPLCLFGGGYLRLAPLPLIRRETARILTTGRPVVFYVHPREIDTQQPRLRLGAVRRFKAYVNLASTEPKIRQLVREFEFQTMEQCWATLEEEREAAEAAR